MNLEITFNEDDVSFNVDCLVGYQELLEADDEIPIDYLDEMDISSLRLRRIPDSIRRLTHLRSLSLANNELDSIPNSIGTLTNLEYLNLHNNRLENCPVIRRLTNLVYLNLSNNRIATIPRTIENLTNLEFLDLSNNNIQNIPASIGALNLLELNLSNNPITRIPSSIGNSRLVTCILPNNILLEPMQEEYVFTNRVVVDELRRVFNIREYNALMKAAANEQNWNERKSPAILSSGVRDHFATKKNTKTKTKTKKNTATQIFYNNRFMRHLSSFHGARNRPLTVEDVIKLA